MNLFEKHFWAIPVIFILVFTGMILFVANSVEKSVEELHEEGSGVGNEIGKFFGGIKEGFNKEI